MLSSVTTRHQTSWPPAPRHVAEARRFVARSLEHEGLSPLVESATLVVSELAANAVRHARSQFRVRLQRHGHEVVIEVEDDCDLPLLVQEAGDLATSGRGLHLVDALSLDWGVRHHPEGGKTVWARFEVPAGRPAR